MENVLIIRIGEIFLKGKNRGFFEKTLTANLKERLLGVQCKLNVQRNRYVVSDYKSIEQEKIIGLLKTVFGVHSLSTAIRVQSDFDIICRAMCEITPNTGSFRITANRGDKTFLLNSMELNRRLGEHLLTQKSGLTVDLHNPDFTVNVDVREEGYTYLFHARIAGAGGMPVSTAGRGLLLLSGGIDSPVAGYMMAKRGLSLEALHFHSYPYTGEAAQKKVEGLAHILRGYCGAIPLMLVPFTRILESIKKHCSENFIITIMRRCMMRIAQRVALSKRIGCIINGESLGQVASQTLESITVTNDIIKTIPILRPLIGMDKQEIIEIAQKIGTFDTSVQPHEDCCTVFLPDKPVIKPKLSECEKQEQKIPDLDTLLIEAFKGIVTGKIY